MPDSSTEVQSEPGAVATLAPRSGLRLALALFLFLTCVYLATSTGRARSIDEIDPVMQSESLLLRHSMAIPQAVGSGIYFGKFDRHGIARSAWPAGHAVMVLPWSALGHGLSRLPGFPQDISDLVVTCATAWSNAAWAALAVAAAFLIFLRLSGSTPQALLCALTVAFATPLFVYSGWLFSEPASAALFLAAACLLFAGGEEPPVPRVLAAALLLAFSLHVRPANMVTVAVMMASTLLLKPRPGAPRPWRTLAILVCVVGLSGVLYLARNAYYFGNPFDFGVPATAENGKDLESWHNPFWRGVFGFLLSPGKSVLLFCPPMILGLLGLPRLWRSNRALAAVCAVVPLANLVLYSFRTQWEGSYCYGPRYLLPGLLFLCLPLGALATACEGVPPRWLRPAWWAVASVGFFVQVVGLSVNVLEDMVRHHYYNARWDYQMNYSPIPGQLALIAKYLRQAPAGIGLGWDRWFVLLRAAGASNGLVVGIEALYVMGAVAFGWLTWREARRANLISQNSDPTETAR